MSSAVTNVLYAAAFSFLSFGPCLQGSIAAKEAALASVARVAISFTADANGDGVLDATEGGFGTCR